MAVLRNYSNIVKGSMLMLFIGDEPIGFATNHALSITMNTTEVSCKDSGDYPGVLPQTITWELTSENFYSDNGEDEYMNSILNKQLLTVKFAKARNYDQYDEKGILGNDHAEWAAATNYVAEGQAYLTSYSINAPNGESATLSVTLTGVGPLKSSSQSTAYVNADDVNIAYDQTTGSIKANIVNPTQNGILTATKKSEASWLTLGSVSGSNVAFTATANAGDYERVAIVTLSYAYGASDPATKDVMITQGKE